MFNLVDQTPSQVTFLQSFILVGSNHEGPSTIISTILFFISTFSYVTYSSCTSNDYQSQWWIFKHKIYLAVSQDLEPTNVKAALQDSRWSSVMKEEIEALQRNNTWTLVLTTAATKIVSNKWVYKIKYNLDGTVSKYKACMVLKGYHQTHGIDFFETFNLVVKLCTFQVVLSLVVIRGGNKTRPDLIRPGLG